MRPHLPTPPRRMRRPRNAPRSVRGCCAARRGRVGESPTWSPDGKALFYASGDTIMRAAIGGGASLEPGPPAPLFRIPGHHSAPRLSGSVSRPVISGITPDKQHFLFRLGTEQGLPSINVVLNWRKALQER